MGPMLDQFVRDGVRSIATFVPWQAAEADISHLLPRFLAEAIQRKLSVSLILTPEPGMNYPNAGVPKSLLQKAENRAKDAHEQGFPQALPPGFYELASLSSAEIIKRWHGTLGRVDAILADLEKTHPHAGEFIQTVITGSLWKYYRSPEVAAVAPFAGEGVDLSAASRTQMRGRLEQTLSSREFLDGVGASKEEVIHWKSKALERVHERWLSQQNEEVFRNRAAQVVGRRSRSFTVVQSDMISPEADPAVFTQQLLNAAGVPGKSFSGLSRALDASLERLAAAGTEVSGEAPAWVHWSGLGGFGTLADSEKQFLILKSLLNAGTRGGCVIVDEAEWSQLSSGFRARCDALAWSLGTGDLQVRERALYLTPHLWSQPSGAWKVLKRALGAEVRLVASLDLALSRPGVRALFVDPLWIFNRETMMRLLEWSGDGRVLVLPKNAIATAPARRMLEEAMRGSAARAIKISQGVPCDIHPAGTGRVILAEWSESNAALGKAGSGYSEAELTTFVEGLLSLSELKPLCQVTDIRVSLIPARRVDSGVGLFILNGHSGVVQADLQFNEPVLISEFSALLQPPGSRPKGGGADPQEPEIAPASTFSLDVPPRGVLPLAVFGSGPDWAEGAETLGEDASVSRDVAPLVQVWAEERRDRREERVAEWAASELQESVQTAALSELHGLGPFEDASSEMPF
jgi:hypothetical protein